MSNDIVLYERWRVDGDAEAFRTLAGRYAGMVYATCRRVLRDATEAEDVAQECFEQLARTKTPPRANVAAWLHRTARNRSISRIRADKSRQEREQTYAASRAETDELAWDDLAHFVDDAINALPEKFRDPVIAHFLNGETHQVIATRYGVTRASITYRVGKGIEGVRKHLTRRGITVGATALATLLGQGAAEAAPAAVMQTIGKLALSGSASAAQGGVAGGAAWLARLVNVKSVITVLSLAVVVIVVVFIVDDEPSIEPDDISQATMLDEAQPGPPESSGAIADAEPASPSAIAADVDVVVASKPREQLLRAEERDWRITGMVVDKATGEPLPNVGLHVNRDAAPSDQYARSDDTGRFELLYYIGYGPFTIELMAYEQVYLPTKFTGERVEGVPTEVVLELEKRASISGHVRNPDGSPAPDLTIMVASVKGGARGSIKTDAEGYYEINHDGGVVRFFANGTMTRSEEAVLELAPEQSVTHDFVMPSSAQIILNITTEDGLVPETIEHVYLDGQRVLGRSSSSASIGLALKKKGDQFLIPSVGPADYTLFLVSMGYEPIELVFTIDEGLNDLTLDVRMHKAASDLRVRIQGEQGQPKTESHVRATYVFRTYDEYGEIGGSNYEQVAKGKTDDKGEYVFAGLSPGLYRISGNNLNQEVTVPFRDVLVLTQPTREPAPPRLRIDMERMHAVDATRDERRLNIEYQYIRIIDSNGTLTNGSLRVGANTVYAFKSGYPFAVQTVTLSQQQFDEATNGQTSSYYNEDLTLAFGEGGEAYGYLEASGSALMSGQLIHVYPSYLWGFVQHEGDDKYEWQSLGAMFAQGAKTDEDGAFQLRFLAPGEYIATTGPDTYSAPFTVRANMETGPVAIVAD